MGMFVYWLIGPLLYASGCVGIERAAMLSPQLSTATSTLVTAAYLVSLVATLLIRSRLVRSSPLYIIIAMAGIGLGSVWPILFLDLGWVTRGVLPIQLLLGIIGAGIGAAIALWRSKSITRTDLTAQALCVCLALFVATRGQPLTAMIRRDEQLVVTFAKWDRTVGQQLDLTAGSSVRVEPADADILNRYGVKGKIKIVNESTFGSGLRAHMLVVMYAPLSLPATLPEPRTRTRLVYLQQDDTFQRLPPAGSALPGRGLELYPDPSWQSTVLFRVNLPPNKTAAGEALTW